MLISVGGDGVPAYMITNILDHLYVLVPILHCVEAIEVFVSLFSRNNSKLTIFNKQKTAHLKHMEGKDITWEGFHTSLYMVWHV